MCSHYLCVFKVENESVHNLISILSALQRTANIFVIIHNKICIFVERRAYCLSTGGAILWGGGSFSEQQQSLFCPHISRLPVLPKLCLMDIHESVAWNYHLCRLTEVLEDWRWVLAFKICCQRGADLFLSSVDSPSLQSCLLLFHEVI